jgi:hypothetical protein
MPAQYNIKVLKSGTMDEKAFQGKKGCKSFQVDE